MCGLGWLPVAFQESRQYTYYISKIYYIDMSQISNIKYIGNISHYTRCGKKIVLGKTKTMCKLVNGLVLTSNIMFYRLLSKVISCQKVVLRFLPYLQTDQHFTFLNLKVWILLIFKAPLASQMRSSCPYNPLSFLTVRHFQFLSNFQSPKFQVQENYMLVSLKIWKKRTFMDNIIGLLVQSIFE